MTDAALVHVASRQYRLACNWKVFVDNYLVRLGDMARLQSKQSWEANAKQAVSSS